MTATSKRPMTTTTKTNSGDDDDVGNKSSSDNNNKNNNKKNNNNHNNKNKNGVIYGPDLNSSRGPLDKKLYRQILLPNGIRCLLIQDTIAMQQQPGGIGPAMDYDSMSSEDDEDDDDDDDDEDGWEDMDNKNEGGEGEEEAPATSSKKQQEQPQEPKSRSSRKNRKVFERMASSSDDDDDKEQRHHGGGDKNTTTEQDDDDDDDDDSADDDDDDDIVGDDGGIRDAAVGILVGVGSMYDPIECQGLAHFVEHLLFMGSTKYPSENEYDSYVSKHGGYNNAMTEYEYTVYTLEIIQEELFHSLDRLIQFFISPLMLPNAIERELNAIESEFMLVKNSDRIRCEQIVCSTCTMMMTNQNKKNKNQKKQWRSSQPPTTTTTMLSGTTTTGAGTTGDSSSNADGSNSLMYCMPTTTTTTTNSSSTTTTTTTTTTQSTQQDDDDDDDKNNNNNNNNIDSSTIEIDDDSNDDDHDDDDDEYNNNNNNNNTIHHDDHHHPLSQFAWGNILSLRTIPQQLKVDIMESCWSFYNTYYYGANMRIVIVGAYTLDYMEQKIIHMFKDVPALPRKHNNNNNKKKNTGKSSSNNDGGGGSGSSSLYDLPIDIKTAFTSWDSKYTSPIKHWGMPLHGPRTRSSSSSSSSSRTTTTTTTSRNNSNDGGLQKLFRIIPVKDRHTISIIWPIPSQMEYWESKPTDFIGHLLGHEGRGSLLSLFKTRLSWATSCTCGISSSDSGMEYASSHALFNVHFTLSLQGIRYWKLIVEIIYKYIGMLKWYCNSHKNHNDNNKSSSATNTTNNNDTTSHHHHWPSYIHDELRCIANISYQYNDEPTPSDLIDDIITDMAPHMMLPPERLLDGTSLLFTFDPSIIAELIENYLIPTNCRIDMTSSTFGRASDYTTATTTTTTTTRTSSTTTNTATSTKNPQQEEEEEEEEAIVVVDNSNNNHNNTNDETATVINANHKNNNNNTTTTTTTKKKRRTNDMTMNMNDIIIIHDDDDENIFEKRIIRTGAAAAADDDDDQYLLNIEPMFGTRFWCHSIPQTWLHKLEQLSKPIQPISQPSTTSCTTTSKTTTTATIISADDIIIGQDLYLPLPNPYVPIDLSLRSLPCDDSYHPLLDASIKICIPILRQKQWFPVTVIRYNANNNKVLVSYEDVDEQKWYTLDQPIDELQHETLTSKTNFVGTMDKKKIKYRIIALPTPCGNSKGNAIQKYEQQQEEEDEESSSSDDSDDDNDKQKDDNNNNNKEKKLDKKNNNKKKTAKVYIPKFPTIPSLLSQNSRLPKQISNTNSLKMWWLHDRYYHRPIVEFRIQIICQDSNLTPLHRACAELLQLLCIDTLTETTYQANLCELESYIHVTDIGFTLGFHGFNDKLLQLFETVMKLLFSFRNTNNNTTNNNKNGRILPDCIQDERRYDACFEDLIRSYKNAGMSCGKLSSSIRVHALRPTIWTTYSKLKAITTTTTTTTSSSGDSGCGILDVSVFMKTVQSIFENIAIEALIHGNVNRSDADQAKDIIMKILDETSPSASTATATQTSNDGHNNNNNNQLMGLPRKKYPAQSVLRIPSVMGSGCDAMVKSSAIIVVPSKDINEPNTAVEMYIQIGKDALRERVIIDLLVHMMNEPMYDQLRTKEQLGYSVYCSERWTFGIMGIVFKVITNVKSARAITNRIEKFIVDYRTNILQTMELKIYYEHVISLMKQKLDMFNNLSEETDSYWTEIVDGRFQWQIWKDEAEMLQSLTKDDLIKAYDTWLMPTDEKNKNKQRRRNVMVVHVIGTGGSGSGGSGGGGGGHGDEDDHNGSDDNDDDSGKEDDKEEDAGATAVNGNINKTKKTTTTTTKETNNKNRKNDVAEGRPIITANNDDNNDNDNDDEDIIYGEYINKQIQLFHDACKKQYWGRINSKLF